MQCILGIVVHKVTTSVRVWFSEMRAEGVKSGLLCSVHGSANDLLCDLGKITYPQYTLEHTLCKMGLIMLLIHPNAESSITSIKSSWIMTQHPKDPDSGLKIMRFFFSKKRRNHFLCSVFLKPLLTCNGRGTITS